MQDVLFPEVTASHSQAGQWVIDLRIPEELAYFDGHFDEVAVVPGVVQIQWVVHFARLFMGVNGVFSHMEAIKFKELLLPGQCLQLHLNWQAELRKLSFHYASAQAEYSAGRLYFHG